MHALVIAALFTSYMGLMAGLIAYACWTGRDPRDDPPIQGRTGERSRRQREAYPVHTTDGGTPQ